MSKGTLLINIRNQGDCMQMQDILNEERFDFIADCDKAFILAFDAEMMKLGYDFGGKIGDGYCWGNYMVIYTKTGVKSRKSYARIYLKDGSIVLRLFFSKIDKHRDFIKEAPTHIKQVFVGDFGICNRCDNEKEGLCKFRKVYSIDDRPIEKCNGKTFWFHNPRIDNMADYVDLFSEFYPGKRRVAS